MKLPKGFRKNYFSLSAITATVNSVDLQKTEVCIKNFHTNTIKYEQDEECEIDDELLPTELLLLNTLKPCHCNCYFLSLSKKTLRLFDSQKLYCEYFQTINNSISPPLLKTIQAY